MAFTQSKSAGRAGLFAGRSGPEAPCPCELAAVFEDDAPLAVKPRLHLFHTIEIHQLRPADARELVRVELVREILQRAANGVHLTAGVEANVVAIRFGPIQPLYRQKNL